MREQLSPRVNAKMDGIEAIISGNRSVVNCLRNTLCHFNTDISVGARCKVIVICIRLHMTSSVMGICVNAVNYPD